MIVTVTPSPSIDWTVAVEAFELDEVNRITHSVQEASGKGVNVSWALHNEGIATRTVFPCGGRAGEFMRDSLAAGGLDFVAVPMASEVRTNITLVTPDSSGTKINMPGALMSADEIAAFVDAVTEAAAGADTLVSCGSLPTGADTSLHHDIVARAKRQYPSMRVIVDTSGQPLRDALDASPDLVKPNVHELADLTNRDIVTRGDVVDAARRAQAMGAGAVLASLGADGVIYVDADGVIYGTAQGIPVVNTVGAGDALLAGFVGGGADRVERVKNALLWSSSAVACASTIFPVRHEFAERIRITTDPDLTRKLTEPSLGAARI